MTDRRIDGHREVALPINSYIIGGTSSKDMLIRYHDACVTGRTSTLRGKRSVIEMLPYLKSCNLTRGKDEYNTELLSIDKSLLWVVSDLV